MKKREILLLVLLTVGAAPVPAVPELPGSREEVTIQAGDFTVVGDLYLPAEGARHPLIVWVHGSGPITRQLMTPLMGPQIEVILRAGFAFFIDDIPGSGASRGEFKSVHSDRASILVREVETLRQRPDIIPDRVGVAGLSQAGTVIPLAASQTSAIAFVIAEACVAESSYRQDAYLAEQFMICEGIAPEEARDVARSLLVRYETTSYQEYVAAAEKVNGNASCQLMELSHPLMAEDRFQARDRSPQRIGPYFDPMPLVERMSVPILALFGGKDKNIDSNQGVEAYRKAVAVGHNPLSRVELIAGANHLMFTADSGCVRELMAQVAAGEPRYDPQALGIIASWLELLRESFGD